MKQSHLRWWQIRNRINTTWRTFYPAYGEGVTDWGLDGEWQCKRISQHQKYFTILLYRIQKRGIRTVRICRSWSAFFWTKCLQGKILTNSTELHFSECEVLTVNAKTFLLTYLRAYLLHKGSERFSSNPPLIKWFEVCVRMKDIMCRVAMWGMLLSFYYICLAAMHPLKECFPVWITSTSGLSRSLDFMWTKRKLV
jgi:hypothetical protein